MEFRRVLFRSGGRIQVESTPGTGSVFSFTVQFDRGDASKIERESEADVAIPAAVGPLRILVAEDDATIRTLIETVLSRKGYAVTAVDNGALAVEEIKRSAYDIVLMDMQMPLMDGADAMRAIRSRQDSARDLPIIALTADALQENLDGYLRSGATVVLTKPIAWPHLLAEIARLTEAAPRDHVPS